MLDDFHVLQDPAILGVLQELLAHRQGAEACKQSRTLVARYDRMVSLVERTAADDLYKDVASESTSHVEMAPTELRGHLDDAN